MKYDTSVLSCEFRILASKVGSALKAVIAISDPERLTCLDHDSSDSEKFLDIIGSLHWGAYCDRDGNISDLCHLKTYISENDYILFQAIAPFVTPGSFISLIGKDKKRWYFDGENRILQMQEWITVSVSQEHQEHQEELEKLFDIEYEKSYRNHA